jgi:hypothetical protein
VSLDRRCLKAGKEVVWIEIIIVMAIPPTIWSSILARGELGPHIVGYSSPRADAESRHVQILG